MIYSALMGIGVTAVTYDLYQIRRRSKLYKHIKQPVEIEKIILQLTEKMDKTKRTRLIQRWLKYKHKRNNYLLKHNYIHSVESIETYLYEQLNNLHSELIALENQLTAKEVKGYRKRIVHLLKGVEYEFTY